VATEHPKVTAYVPKEILSALDSWKTENNIESRSAAIVVILADYLGVPYSAQQEGNALTVTTNALSTVLAELAKLSDRVVALEQQMAVNAVLLEVPGTASIPEPSSTAPIEAPGIVPTSAALQPPAPLTQMALAKRLGVSDKAVEKRRKQGKENFASWSRDRDPDGIAWIWEGAGGRGQPLRFVPFD
jgi:hypothetical protein